MHTTSGIWFWRPNEDIAKATAEEINNAHIFKETFFTSRPSEGDIVLRGTIISTKYDGKIITYGLSFYGGYLWLIGFPTSYVSNELSLSFQLRDDKNKTVLWEKDYHEEIGVTSWLYVMKSDFEYSTLLKRILLNVMSDLKTNKPAIEGKLNTFVSK